MQSKSILLCTVLAASILSLCQDIGMAQGMDRQTCRHQEISLELELLADPLLCYYYPCVRLLEDHIEISGYVPSEVHLHRAEALCRSKTNLPIRNQLRIQKGIAQKLPMVDSQVLLGGARDALASTFSVESRGWEVNLRKPGEVVVRGAVESLEQKLKVSQRLRRVRGCHCIVNLMQTNSQPKVAGVHEDHQVRQVAATSVPPLPLPNLAPISPKVTEKKTSQPELDLTPPTLEPLTEKLPPTPPEPKTPPEVKPEPRNNPVLELPPPEQKPVEKIELNNLPPSLSPVPPAIDKTPVQVPEPKSQENVEPPVKKVPEGKNNTAPKTNIPPGEFRLSNSVHAEVAPLPGQKNNEYTTKKPALKGNGLPRAQLPPLPQPPEVQIGPLEKITEGTSQILIGKKPANKEVEPKQIPVIPAPSPIGQQQSVPLFPEQKAQADSLPRPITNGPNSSKQYYQPGPVAFPTGSGNRPGSENTNAVKQPSNNWPAWNFWTPSEENKENTNAALRGPIRTWSSNNDAPPHITRKLTQQKNSHMANSKNVSTVLDPSSTVVETPANAQSPSITNLELQIRGLIAQTLGHAPEQVAVTLRGGKIYVGIRAINRSQADQYADAILSISQLARYAIEIRVQFTNGGNG